MPSAVTFPNRSSYEQLGSDVLGTHSVCQILGSEDSTQALLIVYDKNAVSPLGCTELTCFRDGDGVRNSEGWTGLERRHSALSNIRFCSTSATTLLGG